MRDCSRTARQPGKRQEGPAGFCEIRDRRFAGFTARGLLPKFNYVFGGHLPDLAALGRTGRRFRSCGGGLDGEVSNPSNFWRGPLQLLEGSEPDIGGVAGGILEGSTDTIGGVPT